MAEPCPPEWTAQDWVHDWSDPDDSVSLTLARYGDDYRLDFPDLCEFILIPREHRILVNPRMPLDAPTLEHLLVDQVLPRYLAHEGSLLMHASAVLVDDAVVLFLGKSGWGKSTLAGLFDQRGLPLLSDDCVMLDAGPHGVSALPTYASLRLHEDSLGQAFAEPPATSAVALYTSKRRLPMSTRGNAEPMPVRAIYFVNDPATAPATISMTAYSPAVACMALIRHAFQLDVTDRTRTATLLAQAGDVARAVPAFQLDYPRDFTTSGDLVDSILRHVTSLPTTSQADT